MFLQFQLGNQCPVHLVGSVGDAQRADRAEKLGKRKVVRDTRSSMHLNRPVDDLKRDVRNGYLDLGDLAAGRLRANFIKHPRGLERQQTSLFQLDARIADNIRVATQFGERFPKGG